MPRTLNGFIVIVIILCGLYWAVAHLYDQYQASQTRKAFRRDRRNH